MRAHEEGKEEGRLGRALKVELGMQGHHITQLLNSVQMYSLELCHKVALLRSLALNLRAMGVCAGLLVKVETLEADTRKTS